MDGMKMLRFDSACVLMPDSKFCWMFFCLLLYHVSHEWDLKNAYLALRKINI